MGRATRRRPRPTGLNAGVFQGGRTLGAAGPGFDIGLPALVTFLCCAILGTAAQTKPPKKATQPERSTGRCRSTATRSATSAFFFSQLLGLGSAEELRHSELPSPSSALSVLGIVLGIGLVVLGVISLQGAAAEAPTEMDNISARIQFRTIDTNGDGSLDLVELSNGLSDFGLTDTEIEAIFIDLDVNNDGRVSEEEYVAGCRRFANANRPSVRRPNDWPRLPHSSNPAPRHLVRSTWPHCGTHHQTTDRRWRSLAT